MVIVVRRDADVEGRSEWIKKEVHRSDVSPWGETKEEKAVQKSAGIGGELAWLKA